MRVRSQAGFTLVEIAIATVLLAIVALGLMSSTSRMIRAVTDDRARTLAAASADARVSAVRQWPTYTTLDSAFAGSEGNTPHPGWTRSTTITRVGGLGQQTDFKRVTITVTGAGLATPVSRTITVAAP